MKFIHTADLHLDSKMDALPKDKNKIRREEIIRSFEKLCDYASLNGVKAVIISGDMFDTQKVSVKTKRRILFAMSKNPTVDFLYLKGNHDEKIAVEEETLPVNLKLFGDLWTKYSYENVDIYGVNFNGRNTEYIYDNFNPEKDRVNIVALHGQVVGYKTKDGGENISIPHLKNKNIDYLALGHIHSFGIEKLDNRGVLAYSGCLEGRGFDETGDKGFCLIDVDDSKVNIEFVKWAERNYYEHEFDLTGEDDFYLAQEKLSNILQEKYPSNSIIKVIFKGEIKEDFVVDFDATAKRLNEIFFYVKIKDKTKLKIEESDFMYDKSVKGEFVREVFSSSLDEEVKNKIIALGLKALKGEEL